MKRHSVYWGFILLVSLFIWEGIKYEYSEAFKFITLTCFGVLSVVFMYLILNKLRCEAYKEPYARLGADILHEFLSGKRGLARQLFGIWVFFTLPFAIFGESVLKPHFWVVLSLTLIGTLWLRLALGWESLKCDRVLLSEPDKQGKLKQRRLGLGPVRATVVGIVLFIAMDVSIRR